MLIKKGFCEEEEEFCGYGSCNVKEVNEFGSNQIQNNSS